MKYWVYLIDHDPDTGAVSNRSKICECEEESKALLVKRVFEAGDPEPNREYIIRSEIDEPIAQFIVCADTKQIDLAWNFQKWLVNYEVNAVVCFSMDELQMIGELFKELKVQFRVLVIGHGEQWQECKTEHRFPGLKEENFAMILIQMLGAIIQKD